jgi:hypothetical protein
MACSGFVSALKKLDDPTIKPDVPAVVIRLASVMGPNCVLANFQKGCADFCSDVSKNSAGCYNCLSDATQCTTGSKKACCPLVESANACNSCLNKHGSSNDPLDALDKCLQETKLPLKAVIGIVAGVLVFLFIAFVAYRTYIQTKQDFLAKEELRESIGAKATQRLIDTLGSDVGADVYRTVQVRVQNAKKSKQNLGADNIRSTTTPTPQASKASPENFGEL